MQRTFQLIGWLLALTIIVLSLVPPTHRPVTGTSQGFEHLSIFLATGAAFGLGYTTRLWILAAALVAFSAAIELAQIVVPGRHARLSDFLMDAAAACAGVGLARALLKLRDAVVKR